MKNLFYLFILLSGLSSIQPISAQKVKYNISGSWDGNAGKKVYLSSDRENEHKIDSTVVNAENTFKFIGTLKQMGRIWISFKDKHTALFIDGDPITINIPVKGKMTINGSENQKILRQSEEKVVSYCFLKLAVMLALSKEKEKNNQPHFDSICVAMDTLTMRAENSMDTYVDSIADNVTAPYYIQDYHIAYKSYGDAVKAYDKLSARVKNSVPGKELAAQLKEMSKYVVGGTAPNFTSTTPEGKKLSLYSLRGHIVLLDFWASWCGPCMREMPNVKKIYQKYHAKGLEVLGVSLDREKAPWVKTIKEKGLVWNHVSSLKEFDDPIARQFHVTAIPRMFILNEEGKIIAQDLRGEALANKMDELFKNK